MKNVQEDIRAWLLDQQDWLQDAAERLLVKHQLDDEDLLAISARLKSADGQKATKHRDFASLVQPAIAAGELRLTSISEIQGIENLSPKSPLEFGKGNLVVIYGHNGSGKSGYTRILKRASGKRRAAALKGNVFGEPPEAQQCKIAFREGAASPSPVWIANASAIEALRAVDIFDSDEAKHYLTRESEAGYVPPLVSMFERLAAACDKVKTQLQTEQASLPSNLPSIPLIYATTDQARRYGALRFNLTPAEVEQLTSWTEQQAAELESLTDKLNTAEPAAVAKQRRAKKQQAEQIQGTLLKGVDAFGAEAVQRIRTLQATARDKRRIAAEAAQVGSLLLEGVGQDTWRAMWEAARAYSQTPYPGKTFPVTPGARCLLCHQELSEDAQKRLLDFETFVQGRLEAEAKTAETAHQTALQELPAPPTDEQLGTQCEAAALTEPEWLDQLKTFWTAARATRAALVSGEPAVAAQPTPDASGLVAALGDRAKSLEDEAAQLDRDAKEFDRARAAKDKLALEAQRWVAEQEEAVGKEIERLKALQNLDALKGLANSRRVSTKASEMAEKVITNAYVSRFNAELSALGATRIRVEIVRTRTDRGRALHQLKLKGTKDGQADPDAVLSEGERRIIALAAFLADVTSKPHVAPFIFDDPISSLDQDFEWEVAKRLAELAKTRQVLVFTHRLSLYGAMEEVARKNGEQWKDAHLVQRCIESFSGAAGHPVAQAVWNSKTDAANNILLDRLHKAKQVGDAGDSEAYRALAQGICSDFRKLLERTVEEDLLYAIVRRHRRSVTTDNKLGALTAITPSDCSRLDGLMTKYSRYEHSQSAETPVLIPDEAELRADIESLKEWRFDFTKRRKAALG